MRAALRTPTRALALALALLAFQTALPGCFGRFALTRKLYALNQSINDKWLRSIVTFVLVAVPVYGACGFVDWALLNTIEFWGGKNPVDGVNSDLPPPPTGLTASADGRTLQLSPDGETLRIELAPGASASGGLPRTLVLSLRAGGAELRDGDGQLISTLNDRDDGAAEVRDASGKLLDEKSPLDRARLDEALRSGGRALLAELQQQGGRRVARR